MKKLSGAVLTPQGWVLGALVLNDAGRIAGLEGRPVSEAQARDAGQPLLLPGFIDLHVHGGGGRDTMEGGDAIRAIARVHAEHGTTALLATTMTAPLPDIQTAMAALAPVIAEHRPTSARVLGVHLEGPYINAGKLGAQPDFVRAPSLQEVLALHAIAPIRMVTLAPEVPGNLDVIAPLVAAGLRVQVGHTQADYEQALAALQAGASGFTHLFNAMSPLQHRAPGAAGAALAHAEFSELIPDLLHVHPGAIRVALRAIPCLYCVSDSTSAAGMPDGEYALGRQRVFKCLGGVRLADGTLAGSTLTLDQGLRNLVGLGLTLAEASQRTAAFAARHLGLADRGLLAPGAWADVVALDSSLQVQQVVVEGTTL
ncbi:MAG: N-acetylglucosamine-6-phosphate deacetylase [Rubrivivax sp.]|jgi:N-acetylglucosamine-6-phosphate deacetylase